MVEWEFMERNSEYPSDIDGDRVEFQCLVLPERGALAALGAESIRNAATAAN